MNNGSDLLTKTGLCQNWMSGALKKKGLRILIEFITG
jgi:hypothetical protein